MRSSASRMSWRRSESERLDIDDAFGDAFSDPLNSNAVNARGRQDVHATSKQGFQIVGQIGEPQADGLLELNHQIDVAAFTGRAIRVGTKQANSGDTILH